MVENQNNVNETVNDTEYSEAEKKALLGRHVDRLSMHEEETLRGIEAQAHLLNDDLQNATTAGNAEAIEKAKAAYEAKMNEAAVQTVVRDTMKDHATQMHQALESDMSFSDVLNTIEQPDPAKVREQAQKNIEEGRAANDNGPEAQQEAPLPDNERAPEKNFLKDYKDEVKKEEILKANDMADWKRLMMRLMTGDTVEDAMEDFLFSALLFPAGYAVYRMELADAQQKAQIKHVDQMAAASNKSVLSLKGLKDPDMTKAIYGDFILGPEDLIAHNNKDVYAGLKQHQDGSYSEFDQTLLNKRVTEKEEALRAEHPELFEGITKQENGTYSKEDADLFRSRYLVLLNPELTEGMARNEQGQYSNDDMEKFKKRLLDKNFTALYERDPIERESKALVAGLSKLREQENRVAGSVIYGLQRARNVYPTLEEVRQDQYHQRHPHHETYTQPEPTVEQEPEPQVVPEPEKTPEPIAPVPEKKNEEVVVTPDVLTFPTGQQEEQAQPQAAVVPPAPMSPPVPTVEQKHETTGPGVSRPASSLQNAQQDSVKDGNTVSLKDEKKGVDTSKKGVDAHEAQNQKDAQALNNLNTRPAPEKGRDDTSRGPHRGPENDGR